MFQHSLIPHYNSTTVEQHACVYAQAKINSAAVRICSERASLVLAGDARSIAEEAQSPRIGKASDCGGRAKRDRTRQTHKRHDYDCVAVSICECCAWDCSYHAMRALLNTAGLGMERQNREFLSLPVVVVWFIRIFPLFRLCRRGEKWKGEDETCRRDIH